MKGIGRIVICLLMLACAKINLPLSFFETIPGMLLAAGWVVLMASGIEAITKGQDREPQRPQTSKQTPR